MQARSFVDTSDLRDAILGNELTRLVDLIVDQGDVVLRKTGVSFPSRAASTVLLISERGAASAADIARELFQPHQLATQRVETLIELGILKRRNDPNDARRKVLALTAKGKKEAALLKSTLRNAQDAFQGLYKEIEVDLGVVALRAIDSLNNYPLAARIEAEGKKSESDVSDR